MGAPGRNSAQVVIQDLKKYYVWELDLMDVILHNIFLISFLKWLIFEINLGR